MRSPMRISLTFDNGPHREVTPVVLNTLAQRGIAATFFVLGKKLADPELHALARRAHAEGHRLGNHTYTHKTPLGFLADPEGIEEIRATQALLGDLASAEPLFRPPGGQGRIGPHLLSQAAWNHLSEGGYTCVVWNCLAREWIDPHAWVEPTLSRCRELDWSTVVIHDLPTGAIDHLAAFLDRMIEEGAEFSLDFPDDCLAMRRGAAMPLGRDVVTQPGPGPSSWPRRPPSPGPGWD